MAPYFIKNLVPRREGRTEGPPLLTVLAGLSFLQWAHFATGWLAWTCDAIDFFAVSLSVSGLGKSFGISESSKIVSNRRLQADCLRD
jgi:SHS family lactate transporter-like MFS transporter